MYVGEYPSMFLKTKTHRNQDGSTRHYLQLVKSSRVWVFGKIHSMGSRRLNPSPTTEPWIGRHLRPTCNWASDQKQLRDHAYWTWAQGKLRVSGFGNLPAQADSLIANSKCCSPPRPPITKFLFVISIIANRGVKLTSLDLVNVIGFLPEVLLIKLII